MNLNKVFLIGRLTADPALRTTPGGQSVATLRVATNRVWTDKAGKKQEDTEFTDIVVWARQAEIASQFLKKGSEVMVEGRLQTRNWDDKQGVKHWKTEVIAERVQFGARPNSTGSWQAGSASGSWQGGSSNQPEASSSAAGPISGPLKPEPETVPEEIPVINLDEGDITAEDLPF